MSVPTSPTPFANAPSRLPRWANTLLVVAIGYALAVLTLKLIPQDAMAATYTPASTSIASVSNKPNPLQLANEIAAVHVFGDATKVNDEPKVEVKQPLVETKLNLQLAGVFAYKPEENAIAIISAGTGDQSAYGIGDKVSGETTLKSVHRDYVILDNRGREEILRLPENVQPIAMRTIQSAGSQQKNANAQGNNLGQPIDLPTTPGALRDALARNPSLLGRVVSAEPYQENGKLVGYRITPKQNPEILESQGIVAGDVITRVNNIQLNSQKQGIRALRNAVKAENLEVVVLRDGIEIPLSISLAQ